MRSLFFTPKPEDVPEEPVSDRQPEENRANDSPDKHIKARRTKNVHFDRRVKSEQTCITIDTGLARFYKEFYDEINNFTKDFDNWKPYTLKRDRANDEVI